MDGEVIIQNLLPHLQAWWSPIKTIGYTIGFIMILIGVGSIISQGRQGTRLKVPIFSVIAGVMLINLMTLVNILTQSMFAKDSETGLSYTAPGGDDPTSLYITFAIYVVMLVGLSGVIYGCILLKRTSEDGRQLGPALTHLGGGTMGVNIVTLLHMLGSSLGPSVESAVTRFLG